MSAPRWSRGRAAPITDRLADGVLLACGLLSLLTVAALAAVFGGQLIEAARLGTQPTLWPLLTGTLLVTTIACAVALPLGLLSAIYLSEFASPSAKRLLCPALELLAGIPTVALGYFALATLSPLLQPLVPGLGRLSALSAGLVVGILIMPVVVSMSGKALRVVPDAQREGALALGADRLAATFRVVLPAAWPGIAAAMVFATGRALGETMIVAIAAGHHPQLTIDPRAPVETMGAWIVHTRPDTAPDSGLFVVGAALLGLTLTASHLGRRLAGRPA
ncbi:MAG: phosphate transport system permease protein [Myxococcota bacterium]